MENNVNGDEKGLILHKHNPFREDYQKFLKAFTKTSIKTTEVIGPVIREKVTLSIERDYIATGFTKLYKNKELLLNLTPDCCKILIYIACELKYEEEKIELTPAKTGLEKRRFSRAILNLLLDRILVKHSRNMYWVNITLLIVGNVNKKSSFTDEKV